MGDNSDQHVTTSKECMSKIDKIIEGALGKEVSGGQSPLTTNAMSETTTASSNIIFNPDNPSHTPSRDVSNSHKGGFRDITNANESTTLSKISKSNDIKNYLPGGKPKELTTTLPGPTDEWVNYQFERLVTERKRSPQRSTTHETMSNNMSQNTPRLRNVEDILRDYSSNDPSVKDHAPRSLSSIRSNLFKIDWMNKSHNNETLESQYSETDKMRRVGSSVDGDIGDMMKSFGAKCSISGTRCSVTQAVQPSQEDKKSPSDSEVDFKPPRASTSGKFDFNEIRTDLSDLTHSFQKEKERLQHLETIIRKTPHGTSSLSGNFQPLRSYHYTSKFLNEYAGRRAFSTTDYSIYGGTSDWRSTSPSTEYLGRTSSASGYRSTGLNSQTSKPNYMSDFRTSKYTPGLEVSRVPSHSRMHENETMNHPMYGGGSSYNHFPKDSGSYSKSKLNRSYNAKKDKNMSKSTDCQNSRRRNDLLKSDNSNSEEQRMHDNQHKRKDNQMYNFNPVDKTFYKTIRSNMYQNDNDKYLHPANKSDKYRPYQPCVQKNRRFPHQTKSETTIDSNMYPSDYYSGQECSPRPHNVDGYGETRHPWSSVLCSSPRAHNPDAETKNGCQENCVSGQAHRSFEGKKVKRKLRSKSECRVLNRSTFPVHKERAAASRLKTSGRKLNTKGKKAITSVSKRKKDLKR